METKAHLIRVGRDTYERLKRLVDEINAEKGTGRKVRISDLLGEMSKSVSEEVKLRAREGVLSPKDKVEMAYQAYLSTNPGVSREEWILDRLG